MFFEYWPSDWPGEIGGSPRILPGAPGVRRHLDVLLSFLVSRPGSSTGLPAAAGEFGGAELICIGDAPGQQGEENEDEGQNKEVKKAPECQESPECQKLPEPPGASSTSPEKAPIKR